MALHDGHSTHRELTSKDIAALKRWVNRLYGSQKSQERRLEAFEKGLDGIEENYRLQVGALEKEISILKGGIENMDARLKKALKGDIEREVAEHHERTRKHVEGRIEELHSKLDRRILEYKERAASPLGQERRLEAAAALTNPEQKLLNLLIGEPDPVTYGQISSRTGHSINTVRVVMNSLKKRGLIEENMLPSGVKLFNVVNREKVKKIYNLEHI